MNLKQLKEYFEANPPPHEPFKLSHFETILDQYKFVWSTILTLENNSGKIRYLPYYQKLIKYYYAKLRNHRDNSRN